MFDFDVVTGPTQPPHCPLVDESAGSPSAESASQSTGSALAGCGTRAELQPAREEKQRS